MLFGQSSPIGRRIGRKREYEVIGMVRNHANFFVGGSPPPIIYLTLFEEPIGGPLTLAIRGGSLPRAGQLFSRPDG